MAFPPPLYLQLYPTERCNQKCTFCFNASAGTGSDLTHDQAMKLLEIMQKWGIHDLDIMGGEPFLLPWMVSFLHAAAARGISLNVSSNGSMPEVMEAFRGMSPDRLTIGISLEGGSEASHNCQTNAANFNKAVKSISTLVSLGMNPIVKTVVSLQTMADIQNMVTLLIKLGVQRYYLIHMDLMSEDPGLRHSALSYPDFLNFFRAVKAGNPKLQIHRVNASCFEKDTLPRGIRCAGGVRKLAIMPDGSAYPCNLFQHAPDYRLGNILEDDLEEIWENPRLDFFRGFENNRCTSTGCSNHHSCTGGCPAHGYFHAKDPDSPDVRCRLYQ